MNYQYETPTFRANKIELQYRRSTTHDWNSIDMLDVPELKKIECRKWNLPLTLVGLACFIVAFALPRPLWFYAVVAGVVLLGIASSIGPKRTRLILRTNQLQYITALDSNNKTEIDEAYGELHYLVYGDYPKVAFTSSFDEMAKRIQADANKQKPPDPS